MKWCKSGVRQTFYFQRMTACGAVAVGLACLSMGAAAQAADDSASTQDGFELRQFIPAPGTSNGYLSVRGADVSASPRLELSLSLDMAQDPLLAHLSDGTELGPIVSLQANASLLGNIGVFPWLDVGFELPLTLAQTAGDITEELSPSLLEAGFGAGDVRISARAALWQSMNPETERANWLAFQLGVSLPSGNQSWLQGEPGPRLMPLFLFEHATRVGIKLAANAGLTLRPEATFQNLDVGNSLDFGLASLLPVGGYLAIIPELAGHAMLTSTELGAEELPLEARAAIRYRFNMSHNSGQWLVQAGGGLGVIAGYGTPRLRGLVGLSYVPPDLTLKDQDQDGVLDVVDRCRDVAEDLDQFEDWDGCPELDNDQDFLPDTHDICQNEPEDKDGFEDEDGCPDPDNDNDKVADAQDKCPARLEDFDGFEDADGCPDLDNDADGIADKDDKCPTETEDPDEVQDTDGCPERDADADGVLDPRDRCPLAPETVNGFEDQDGCPEQSDKPAPSYRLTVTCKKIELKEQIFFETGSAEIMPKSFPLLDELARTIRSNPWILKLQVEGHTDDRGSDELNMTLSDRRAGSVKMYLNSKGVEPQRMQSVGYGKTRPVASNVTERGRSLNRRVEITILETDNKCQP